MATVTPVLSRFHSHRRFKTPGINFQSLGMKYKMSPINIKIAILVACVLFLSHLTKAVEFPTLSHVRSKTPPAVQAKSVTDLLVRVIADRASDFLVTVNQSIGPPNRDTFKLVSSGAKLSITGTSGVAVAMGFYYYLKYYCGGQVTWAGQQTDLPAELPHISSPGVTITSNDQFRYYQNVCTVSYSFAWWDWTRWEREIDWMALQGINLPLAFTGQEAIFQRVYMTMGFAKEDLDKHFGGPAFLAWARMGNIRGFGGPLPQSWIDNRLTLQHNILNRMRSLGMTPVLPGFAGHVPSAITRVFPHANVTRLGSWGDFGSNYSETYLLDFNDRLFTVIGSNFIKTMDKEFGIDHIYNSDSFNEMTPRSSDPAYLASAARGVYNAMVNGDPQAVWLMQGWLFHETSFWKLPQIKALLTAVPRGKMIILDLNAESSPLYSQTESFYGQPFIWCMLHNFGGLNEMYGKLTGITEGPFTARTFPNTTMVGTGLTPEGINQNEVMYELMNEHAWRNSSVHLDDWIEKYQAQRYLRPNNYTSAAWALLKESVYTSGSSKVIIIHRPSFGMSEHFDYDPEVLYQAWDNMVRAADLDTIKEIVLFRYDLVDVSKESLHVMAIQYYKDMMNAYNRSNTGGIRTAGRKMIDLLSDLDLLLASDDHFLLGRWISDASRYSTNEQEKVLFDFNSRNQVTLWGYNGEIRDYACKLWSDLVNRYYKPRWQLFIDAIVNCSEHGTTFNQTAYNQLAFETVEFPFSNDQTVFSNTTTGDAIALSIELHAKYRPDTMQSTTTATSSSPLICGNVSIVLSLLLTWSYFTEILKISSN